mmetsp:Transcript_11357/g.36099  ORF Transcript_11357/g.36099 Transcript_11357/m.36099 type:complete len:321 (+) Transcript_11357:2578-3540(+)
MRRSADAARVYDGSTCDDSMPVAPRRADPSARTIVPPSCSVSASNVSTTALAVSTPPTATRPPRAARNNVADDKRHVGSAKADTSDCSDADSSNFSDSATTLTFSHPNTLAARSTRKRDVLAAADASTCCTETNGTTFRSDEYRPSQVDTRVATPANRSRYARRSSDRRGAGDAFNPSGRSNGRTAARSTARCNSVSGHCSNCTATRCSTGFRSDHDELDPSSRPMSDSTASADETRRLPDAAGSSSSGAGSDASVGTASRIRMMMERSGSVVLPSTNASAAPASSPPGVARHARIAPGSGGAISLAPLSPPPAAPAGMG